jgi:hypothetical protein
VLGGRVHAQAVGRRVGCRAFGVAAHFGTRTARLVLHGDDSDAQVHRAVGGQPRDGGRVSATTLLAGHPLTHLHPGARLHAVFHQKGGALQGGWNIPGNGDGCGALLDDPGPLVQLEQRFLGTE